MKRTSYNWQHADCFTEQKSGETHQKICPFTVYMLSSNNGNGPGGFVGYFMSKMKAEEAIQKSTIKTLKTKLSGGMILP